MKILHVLMVSSLVCFGGEMTYEQYENLVKKKFVTECVNSAGLFANELCKCALIKMEKEYFTAENKQSLQSYLEKMNAKQASLVEKQALNQFANDVIGSAGQYSSICLLGIMAKSERESKAKEPKAPKKNEKEEKIYKEKVQKILSKHWQEVETTLIGESAVASIKITNKGSFSYKIVSPSYNNEFNTKFKNFLKKMETIQFPSYTQGDFFEMQVTFKDTEE